ncbi:MAG: ABC transporter permease, partial [Planctomycetota bacterium]
MNDSGDNLLRRATRDIRDKPLAFAVAVACLFVPLALFLILPVFMSVRSGFFHAPTLPALRVYCDETAAVGALRAEVSVAREPRAERRLLRLELSPAAPPGGTTFDLADERYDTLGALAEAIRERPGWHAELVGVADRASARLSRTAPAECLGGPDDAVELRWQREARFSGYWLARVLGNARLMGQLRNGVLLACCTTMVCLVLAVPLAALRARCRFAGQGLLGTAVLVPLILPPFVGALAMQRIMGRFGMLNLLLESLGILQIAPGNPPPDWLATGFVGVVVVQALHLFPILYLNASAALANVDPAYGQAARNLGAGPVRTFFRITLPLMRPGLFAGGTIVFIWSLTDIGTPLILNYRELIPVTIFHELNSAEYTGRTFSLVFILLVASVALYVLGKFVFGRPVDTGSSKATIQAETRKLGAAGTLLAWLGFGVVIALALLPHVGVVLLAVARSWGVSITPPDYTLDHLRGVVTSTETYNSMINSLRYAGVSTAIDLGLGGLAAWLIVRTKVAGRRVLDALVMLPLAIPGVILAAGYVAMTVPGSLLEGIGPRGNPFMLIVIAYAVRRIPFVVRGVSAGLQQVPESLEEAARNLGARPHAAARRITLPLISANFVAAGVLTFAFAMLEVS